jgi:hypothetical protein
MKIFLRNPKISGFQVGLPENIRVFGSGSGRVGSTRTRPETRFFRVPLYALFQLPFSTI